MPDEIATGMGCPTCWNNGSGIKAMLFARHGKFSYYCRTGHEFNDMQELKAMDPPMLQVPQKKAVQEDHVDVNLSIPKDLKDSLLQKFGSPDKLAQTLAGILRVMAEKQCFLINEVDIERIEKETGSKPKTGAEIFGIIWQQKQTIKELQDNALPAASPAESSQAPAPGTIQISTQEFLAKARAIANFRNQTVQQVIEQTLKMAFDNGWA